MFEKCKGKKSRKKSNKIKKKSNHQEFFRKMKLEISLILVAIINMFDCQESSSIDSRFGSHQLLSNQVPIRQDNFYFPDQIDNIKKYSQDQRLGFEQLNRNTSKRPQINQSRHTRPIPKPTQRPSRFNGRQPQQKFGLQNKQNVQAGSKRISELSKLKDFVDDLVDDVFSFLLQNVPNTRN